MARQNSAIESSSFARGIITEASPLNFPEGASLDERNFEILRDGSRQRRLGMDYEPNFETEGGLNAQLYSDELVCTTYRWLGLSGEVDVLVVQVGRTLTFFDNSASPLSGSEIAQFEIEEGDSVNQDIQFTYSNLGNILVVATGKSDIDTFTYNSGTITRDTTRLRVRDIWGVETSYDPVGTGAVDLREESNLSLRPVSLSDEHYYNLRNQTWGPARKTKDSSAPADPIYSFFNADGSSDPTAGGVYPSNADSVILGLYPNPEDAEDPVGDRFWESTIRTNTLGSTQAPLGYFIIDLMERSKTRLEEADNLHDRDYTGAFGVSITPLGRIEDLPLDKTQDGPVCVSSFGGRMWYAGFNGDLIGGDKYSPRLSSYVAFSQLVQSKADLNKCYQAGDPTSALEPDLVDTDGGIISIPEARSITRLFQFGNYLLVFATNGVWAISGGSEYGFSATNYRVDRVSDVGLVGPHSVVEVDSSVLFWSLDGIYSLSIGQNGGLSLSNLTENSIQSLFNDINFLDKRYARGVFDKFDRKVRWIYNSRFNSTGNVKELVFDITLPAFYVHEIHRDEGAYPLVCDLFEVPPYSSGVFVDDVVVNGDQVTVNGEDVTITSSVRENATRSIKYLTIVSRNVLTDQTFNFTFSLYSDQDFLDWKTRDGVGVDAPAYLITGYAPGLNQNQPTPDRQRFKQVPYLTMHFLRTEDGFEDVGGDLIPTNQSSCKVQARWDWANSANSNRWGREFQAYRYKRFYMPTGVSDDFDTGFETIVTKNKIRGKGRVVSFRMSTDPGKDCRILGWSMIMGSNGNV